MDRPLVVIVPYGHPDGAVTNKAWQLEGRVATQVLALIERYGVPIVEHTMNADELADAAEFADRLEVPALWADA